MLMGDFIAVVESESARCLGALRSADLSAPVPSCPDWNGADLAWHLAEVQHFWASIVADLLDDPEGVERFPRPADDELIGLFADRSAALVSALTERSPEDVCWSWHEDGGRVGWVARRQAHEALIHRVDAELVAGKPITDVDPNLAADGVDEALTVMIEGVPPWGRFEADGATIGLRTTDTGGSWALAFGRFTGTSPNSGRSYDLDAALLLPDASTGDATVESSAWNLDQWLWGRAGEDVLAVSGDPELVARLRSLAIDATQ